MFQKFRKCGNITLMSRKKVCWIMKLELILLRIIGDARVKLPAKLTKIKFTNLPL